MRYRVLVTGATGHPDLRGRMLQPEIERLGIEAVTAVETADLYFLEGDLDGAAVERLGAELLADPLVQRYSWERVPPSPGEAEGEDARIVEVALLPGVTDTAGRSLLAGARLLGLAGLEWAATGQRYLLRGRPSEAEMRRIAEALLANEFIQEYRLGPIFPARPTARHEGPWVEVVPLRQATAEELARLSRERLLSLDGAEMAAIQAYYCAAGRDPTDVELETLAQTWSEHCVHKTFKALVDYIEYDGERVVRRERIDGLLKTFIRAATEEVAAPWVRSAFVDNAGIIDFDGRHEVSFKAETHNHPSALEPFGGANTGIGGVVRDIIGVSARPIANTGVLCLGPQDLPYAALPPSVLHPRRVYSGAVAGIQDYGNRMGIPTVNGALLFDAGYIANPLVYCGCLGIAPLGRHRNRARPGDLAVVLGGRTGRDGLHGATFSSAELAHDTGATVGGAVQIGDPLTEKLALEAVLEARDRGLYTAITDCGAGGLSSAVGEMGQECGVTVQLENVPQKYDGLRPWEIWLSEAQERMVLAVPPADLDELLAICRRWDVEATAIGTFREDGRLVVRHGAETVADLEMAFLHDGLPRRELPAVWRREGRPQPALPPVEVGQTLLSLLAHPDLASKEAVFRRFDHEAQGGTAVKPFVGPCDGPSDAAVIVPLEVLAEAEGGPARPALAVACGIAPRYGELDPYAMAVAAVDEAVRNVVAVGADPDRISLLDNFCWGNPQRPEQMGSLVQAARGCHDAAIAYQAPFISGKDSLNNEYDDGRGGRTAIPPTLLISSLGMLADVAQAVTMDLKESGNALYLLGRTRRELGGSYLHRQLGLEGGTVPQPAEQGPALARALHGAIRRGLIRASHDCAAGGLAVAAAEMALASGLGLRLELAAVPRDPDADDELALLFAESNARYLVEVRPQDEAALVQAMAGLPCARIGRVAGQQLTVTGLDGREVVDLPVRALARAWKGEAV